jgi:hypothetical protein
VRYGNSRNDDDLWRALLMDWLACVLRAQWSVWVVDWKAILNPGSVATCHVLDVLESLLHHI